MQKRSLLLEEIMGAFFAPLLVISGAKLYFLGAVLPFALVYFGRWSYPSYFPWTRLAWYHCDLVTFVSEQTGQLPAHEARSSSYKEEDEEEHTRTQAYQK